MGVKHGLRSSSAKFSEPTPSKSNKPLLEGDENPSIEEQWIISPFFEDYLFHKNLDCDSALCSGDLSYTACGEPDDLLTMDLELKRIPRLGTYKGDFGPTVDVVFKSHTSISRGWRSWCRRVLAHPSFMDILQRVKLVNTILVFSNLEINKDNESLLSLLYQWNPTTHTFFTRCQEISPSLEDVYEILRLPLFGVGEVVNIPLSLDESKVVKFLKDVVKKTLKKLVLKAVRRGKPQAKKYQRILVLVETRAPRPTSGDGSSTSRENMLMAWMRKPMKTS